jgi:ACS family hexuronate transporter-like MFS transporter
MVALAFFATTINYLDRQTLSVAAPVLIDQFGMSHAAYARVVFAFMLAYTIANGISGPLLDRLGTRLGFALTMAWWSAASILNALARGPRSLGACQFLLGAGEAGNWPACVKVVAEWFPVKERALASGIFNSGSAAGAILAPPVVVWLLLHYGWRQAFVGVGAVGFAWLVIWSLVYSDAPPQMRKGQFTTPYPLRSQEGSSSTSVQGTTPYPLLNKGGDSSPPSISPWKLFRTRFVWSFTLAKVFLDPVWYFYIFWFPEYLKRARHFSMASIGKYAWVPFFVAGLGNVLGGWVSGWMLKRGYSLNMARKGGVTFFAALMTCAIPAVLARDASTSIVLVSVAMLGYTGCGSIMLAYPADVYPKNMVGSIWGLASMGSGFGGMVFALLTGVVVDRFSFLPVFVGFGLMPLLCTGILWTLLGPITPSFLEVDFNPAS